MANGKTGETFADIAAFADRLPIVSVDYPLAVSAILQLLGWFLLWVGSVVTIAGWFVWKKNKSAIFLAAIVGGFSDMGYFIFIDLNGWASLPGKSMTYICVTSIAISFWAYWKIEQIRRVAKD